jgi:hypothetical protein
MGHRTAKVRVTSGNLVFFPNELLLIVTGFVTNSYLQTMEKEAREYLWDLIQDGCYG